MGRLIKYTKKCKKCNLITGGFGVYAYSCSKEYYSCIGKKTLQEISKDRKEKFVKNLKTPEKKDFWSWLTWWK